MGEELQLRVRFPLGGVGGQPRHDILDSQRQRVSEATVWTSLDGVLWTNTGEPGFETADAEWVQVQADGDLIRASVIANSGSVSGDEEFESWITEDGVLTWRQEDSMFPLITQFFDFDFGRVAMAMPQSQYMLWISADGESWEEVASPPGSHGPDGAGSASAGAAGDVIWLSIANVSGPRTLWIGSIEPAEVG